MQHVRLFNKATGQYSDQPPKTVGMWQRHGWEVVNPDPPEVEDEDSAEKADKTADHDSRGKPSARTHKDK
jgi:hypothetical protein